MTKSARFRTVSFEVGSRGQIIMVEHAGGIGMGQRRAAAVCIQVAERGVSSGKTSVGGGFRFNIMFGMPEKAVVVFRSVPVGMVDVDILDMATQFMAQHKPVRVAGGCKLLEGSENTVILVVVVCRKHFAGFVQDAFMVCVQVPEVPPPVFVCQLPALEKRVFTCYGGIDGLPYLGKFCGFFVGEKRENFGPGICFRREYRDERGMDPVQIRRPAGG